MKIWLGVAAPLVLAACSSGGGDGGSTSAPIWIAVDADVPLQIGILDPVPASLTDVTINSSTFTLGTPQLGFQQVEIPVRASQPGDAAMVIHFRDDRGKAWRKTVNLHAAEITRSTVEIQCSSFVDTRTIYTFTPGATFTFIAQAFADAMPLLSGTLELVQASGFTIAAPTGQDREQRTAAAPAQTGSYAWQLTGAASIAPTFVVYDGSVLDLTLMGNKDPISRITSLTLRRDVAGAPVCVHDHDDRITITVTAGACRPAMSGAEVMGPMPLNARRGDPSFLLLGSGSCTVEARVEGGSATSATYDVEPEMFRPAQSSGMALSPTAVQIGADPPVGTACGSAATDGNCDGKPDPVPVSDPDCLLNSAWYIGLLDGTQNTNSLGPGDLVGVGLTTELVLEIVAYSLIPVGPPQNLRLVNAPAGSLQTTDLGCNGPFQHLALVAQAAGQPSLELHADNLDDVGSFSMQARAIARTVFETTDEANGVPAPDATVDFFIHSRSQLGVHYEATDGSRLRGYAPLLITSDRSGSGALLTSDPLALYTGDVAHTVTVASPRVGAAQTIRVADGTAIAGIGGDFADASVARGETRCVAMYPTVGGGRRIFGTAPSRPVLTFTGSAVVMGQDNNGLCGDGVALEAFATGSSGLAFTWGTGSAAHTWTVTGP